MGQTTTAIMYAIEQAPPKDFDEGWYTLVEKFKEAKCRLHAGIENEPDMMGFFVAVGASGEAGVPALANGKLYTLAGARCYQERIALVVKESKRVDALAAKLGAKLGKWDLWLVQVEVA